MTAEHERLSDPAWRQWGPYLSERQWGTVREDKSAEGNAWNYFSHDQARSRVYTWGEDGLGGISDLNQHLCFAIALWNGHDPILKERLFGLTNSEGNHGEDVKEYYFYLDNVPSHAYMQYLYKYPQAAFPYDNLVEVNQDRGYADPEYELVDTGIFAENRYFDVFIEYAKQSPTDTYIRIRACNRGPDPAPLHILPTLWFRHTWTDSSPKPKITVVDHQCIGTRHPELPDYYLRGSGRHLFTDNETNAARLWGQANASPFTKDAFHRYLIHNETDVINAAEYGTKACFYEHVTVNPGESAEVILRLSESAEHVLNREEATALFETRKAEADAYYAALTPAATPDDQKAVLRQALSGLLWTKQFYRYHVPEWLSEANRQMVRNSAWAHFEAKDILIMPDKWEYPWFAAWDHAFHASTAAMLDLSLAKEQLLVLTQDRYLHPNGQIPAYEWNFGDVNPPVHAMAVWRVYNVEKELTGQGDRDFLERSFHKLLLNFTWWVNRKDESGNNVFQGGFLGLDNIGVFDRSSPLPTGGYLEQADGSAWMAMYSLDMLVMALELAMTNPAYEEVAAKFYRHFFYIAGAMDRLGNQADELWDEEDGFFYDVLRLPDGHAVRLKVKSLVGLVPLLATAVIEESQWEGLNYFRAEVEVFRQQHPELFVNTADPTQLGVGGRHLLSVVDETKLRRILGRMLDEDQFLAPGGIRSLSRQHLRQPYMFYVKDEGYKVAYVAGESNSGMFGGNSNWRGPIWIPLNVLLVQALLKLYSYYGDSFRMAYPTGSDQVGTLWDISQMLIDRIISMFVLDAKGERPVFGGQPYFNSDPYWRDHVPFYEYFNGDTSAGIGASHQTGWTAAVARLIQFRASVTAEGLLAMGLKPVEGDQA